MKRAREDDVLSYQSPLRAAPQRSHAPVTAADITPIKRQRDRSVPLDAMSRLMTAATSAARMKKRAQMTLTSLFGGGLPTAPDARMDCCAVCVAATATLTVKKPLVPVAQLQRCAHCERAIGACCSRECDGCTQVFCSQCSTINCDEQYDRVFCLSCNYDLSR